MSDLRDRLIRLAYNNPEHREALLRVIKKLGEGKGAPSYMSVSNLQKLSDQSSKLLEMIDQNTPLDDWVEALITEAASKIDSVYEHLMYPNEGPTAGKVAESFEEAIKGKKFKHPDTGNDVKFKSLPEKEQKKVRKEWKKKNKGDSDSDDKGSVGDKTKQALDKVESKEAKSFVTDGGMNKGSEERKKASEAIKDAEYIDEFLDEADDGVIKNSINGVKKMMKGEDLGAAEEADLNQVKANAIGAAATAAGAAVGGPPGALIGAAIWGAAAASAKGAKEIGKWMAKRDQESREGSFQRTAASDLDEALAKELEGKEDITKADLSTALKNAIAKIASDIEFTDEQIATVLEQYHESVENK